MIVIDLRVHSEDVTLLERQGHLAIHITLAVVCAALVSANALISAQASAKVINQNSFKNELCCALRVCIGKVNQLDTFRSNPDTLSRTYQNSFIPDT